MKITQNATIFAALNSLTTVLFVLKLNDLITTGQYGEIAPWAIGYGLIWIISGAALGLTDKARHYRGNIEVQYSLIAVVIGLITLWATKLLLPTIMTLSYGRMVWVSLFAIIGAVVLYRLANQSAKGIDKEEAFK